VAAVLLALTAVAVVVPLATLDVARAGLDGLFPRPGAF
jgi:hypothetical protein